ncbi:MAG TPA: hypothetical protein VMS40_11850 [Vicinamibacterales bacterium]|nr:hypothetical protein [Vicinamibacterales bacterium]
MPLVRALRPWYNREHEGWVEPGHEFETSEYRATELVNTGLAVYAVSSTEKISVTADPPPEPDPDPDPPEAPPRKAPAKRKSR